jgi:hypothetical protein
MATGGTTNNNMPGVADDTAMKVINEQQDDSQMIREVNEEELVGMDANGPLAAAMEEAPTNAAEMVGEVIANEPLNSLSHPTADGEEEKRTVKMATDDSVLSS